MKKLFSILLLIALTAFAGHSQQIMPQTDPAGATASVNTNADTSYHTIDLYGQANNFAIMQIVVAGTKTSGTVGGAVTLWGSVDNSRWFAIYAGTPAVPDTLITSVTLTDGDNNIAFQLTGPPRWRYIRTRVITSGTQVSSYVSRILGRKDP